MYCCEHLRQWAEDPDVPVTYDPDKDEFIFGFAGGYQFIIIHCFLCGDFGLSDEERTSECGCSQLARTATNSSVPIEFDAQLNEYHVLLMGGGYLFVHYCPFCGRRTASSRRSELFVLQAPDEVAALRHRLQSADSLERVIAVLGMPDREIWPPPHDVREKQIYSLRDVKRVLIYSSLASTVDLYVNEEEDGHVVIDFVPKEKKRHDTG